MESWAEGDDAEERDRGGISTCISAYASTQWASTPLVLKLVLENSALIDLVESRTFCPTGYRRSHANLLVMTNTRAPRLYLFLPLRVPFCVLPRPLCRREWSPRSSTRFESARRTPVHRRHFASVRVVNGKRGPPHWGNAGNQCLSTMEARDTSRLSFFSSQCDDCRCHSHDWHWRRTPTERGVDGGAGDRNNVETTMADRRRGILSYDTDMILTIYTQSVHNCDNRQSLHEIFRRNLWTRGKADYTRPQWRIFYNRVFYLLLKRVHCIEFHDFLLHGRAPGSLMYGCTSCYIFQFNAIQSRLKLNFYWSKVR